MKITIINPLTTGRLQSKNERNEKRYTREELDDFVAQLREGKFRQKYVRDYNKEICFAAEWQKVNGELKSKVINPLVLLSLENLRDLTTVEEYKRYATQLPYTLLCFIGHDGHSLHIVCRYTGLLLNAFRKLHYIYSSQLGTQVADHEPTLETSCMVSYDPKPYYNPSAIAITVGQEPEETPEYRTMQEDISDYNYPEEIPGLSLHDSRMRRFHDCLDAAIVQHHDLLENELYTTAVVETLADGCRQMGLPQAWCARVASFIPMLTDSLSRDTIESIFRTAYLHETLKTIPLKFTRPSALLTFKTEAYMKEHYTLRLNVMTGTPEYRLNAVGYGFQPLDQAARNTMAIKALKAGVESWEIGRASCRERV